MHVPLTCNAQTSDRPVEVEWSIILVNATVSGLADPAACGIGAICQL